MYGVSRITAGENVMLISYKAAEPAFMTRVLNLLADAGVVVDMISQTPPSGSGIRFSFTADERHLDAALKAIGGESRDTPPMVSGGYAKLNLYGQEMVESVGVAARALSALNAAGIEVAMITTSDLDISLLVRQEDVDVAVEALRGAYKL